mmetsp:Transcript_14823/g.56080  ORF Transcript_14823/g.56080 Transcript_14823/m.56080 type:complete len:202 (-) Transcript_14823:531-1136(-)
MLSALRFAKRLNHDLEPPHNTSGLLTVTPASIGLAHEVKRVQVRIESRQPVQQDRGCAVARIRFPHLGHAHPHVARVGVPVDRNLDGPPGRSGRKQSLRSRRQRGDRDGARTHLLRLPFAISCTGGVQAAFLSTWQRRLLLRVGFGQKRSHRPLRSRRGLAHVCAAICAGQNLVPDRSILIDNEPPGLLSSFHREQKQRVG